jgi:SAM-dependent methyltransferase
MASDVTFDAINEAKANMDHIYDQRDPRAYFRELKKLGYTIPSAAKPVFQKLVSCLQRRQDETVRVLDVGCSYGVNAAILRYDLSMPELYDHWGQTSLADASTDKVVECDQRFFANLDEAEDVEVIGLDKAVNAVRFAEAVGLLDESLAVNLEIEPLPADAREPLASVDLIVSTGCVGYVTEKSFSRLMPAVSTGKLPWIANFVLRMFPFDAIQKTLSERGYVTEKLEGHTFVQRGFVSAEEQEKVLEQLLDKGVNPSGKETGGHLLAEFYLSRPSKDAGEEPIEQFFAA